MCDLGLLPRRKLLVDTLSGSRIGVFDVAAYTSQWRTAVLIIVIVSAILTPADPYSLLFLAVPLCLLYFGGVGLCRWFGAGDQATKASQ